MNEYENEDEAIKQMIKSCYSPLEIARIIGKPAGETEKRINAAIKSIYHESEEKEK